jgi:hypothetical protein
MAEFIPQKGDFSFLRIKKTGRYFGSFLTGGAITTQSLASANSLRAFPFFIPKTIKFDRIAIRVSTAATGATPRIRLGVYEDKGDGSVYPGALVLDAGEVAVNTIGLKELAIDLTLKGGKLYWLSLIGQDTATLAAAAIPAADSLATFLGLDNSLSGTPYLGYAIVQAYGALPASFPTDNPTDWSLPVPLIALRKA